MIFGVSGIIATESWNNYVQEGDNFSYIPNIFKIIREFGEEKGFSVLGIFLTIGAFIGIIFTIAKFNGMLGKAPELSCD